MLWCCRRDPLILLLKTLAPVYDCMTNSNGFHVVVSFVSISCFSWTVNIPSVDQSPQLRYNEVLLLFLLCLNRKNNTKLSVNTAGRRKKSSNQRSGSKFLSRSCHHSRFVGCVIMATVRISGFCFKLVLGVVTLCSKFIVL